MYVIEIGSWPLDYLELFTFITFSTLLTGKNVHMQMLDLAKLLDTMAANYAIKAGLCHLPKGKISLFSLLAANYAIKREFFHLPEQKISVFSLLESCWTLFIGLPTMGCRSPNLACFNEVTLCSVVISVWTMFHLQTKPLLGIMLNAIIL